MTPSESPPVPIYRHPGHPETPGRHYAARPSRGNFAGDHTHLSRHPEICFLCDFLFRLVQSARKLRFFVQHLFYLLISIPYLTLLSWADLRMTHDWGILVGMISMLRLFLAMFIIVQWMVRGAGCSGCLRPIFFTVVAFTYLSRPGSFYDYEV